MRSRRFCARQEIEAPEGNSATWRRRAERSYTGLLANRSLEQLPGGTWDSARNRRRLALAVWTHVLRPRRRGTRCQRGRDQRICPKIQDSARRGGRIPRTPRRPGESCDWRTTLPGNKILAILLREFPRRCERQPCPR